MAARRGDLERALGDFLALDLGEVGAAVGRLGLARPRRRRAARVPFRWVSKARRSGAASTSSSPAQLASLPCAAGQIRPLSSAEAWIAASSTPGRRRDPPVEAELADRDIMRQRLGVGRADRRQQAERDRQIVMRAFLGQVGGRQVDRDALGRQRQADRGERGADPLAALGDRLVGQADDDEGGKPDDELDLHLDGARFEPEISDGGDGRGHQAPPPERRNAGQNSP